jgi:nudix-type nucleoside diphosphatase (YffH/AdpP family)
MDDAANDETQIRTVETLSENWYPLRKYTVDYRRRDGSRQTLTREVYFNGPGSAVLLLDAAGETVMLARQFRLPALVNGDTPRLIEVCAGNIEDGDDPAETARKEAQQETGYHLHDLRKVMTLYMSPGASAEKLHLYIARYDHSDRLSQGGGLREEGEEIELLEIPIDRAWQMVQAGEIADAKTVLLLQHVLLARAQGRNP